MKWVRRTLVALLAIGMAAAIYWAMQTPPVRVDAARVTRGPLMVTVDEDGKTRIKERYMVSAPIAGRLLRIEIEPGDSVVAGETIVATIEPSDPQLLNPRELATAEAREKAAEAALLRAEPAVMSAKAELDFAEAEMGRQNSLAESKTVSTTSVENARRAYRTAAERYRSAKFSEDIARFELEQAKAALMPARGRTAGDANEDAKGGRGSDADAASLEETESTFSPAERFDIRSPIRGRVLRLLQESSSVVTPGLNLLEVGDPTDLELEIDVLSSDAVQVLPGQNVMIEHWGGEKPLSGVVRLVEPSAFTKISALGVEEQRVNVIIDITDPVEERPTLGDGFRVDARIIVWASEDVLRVPTSALFQSDNQWHVFVVKSDRAIRTAIRIGRRNVLSAEVLDGLKPDDLVILHPNDQITDNTQVSVSHSGP